MSDQGLAARYPPHVLRESAARLARPWAES